MNDLELAKKILKEKNRNLVIAKEGKILIESNSEGIKDFLMAAIDLNLEGSSAADTTVGRAIALLCIHSKVKSVFANTTSEHAIDVLKNTDIHFEFENVIEKILNKDGTDICPFEKIALKSSPEEIIQKFKNFLKI